MTGTLTTTDLLKQGNSEFMGFLRLWVLHREPPIPFIDWLTEQGLEGAAGCVRWVLEQPIREVYWKCLTLKGKEGLPVLSLPFPIHLAEDDVKLKDMVWSWVAIGTSEYAGILHESYHRADRIQGLKGNYDARPYADFGTCEEALCYLLDQYEPEAAECQK